MEILRGYLFQILPNGEQQRLLNRFCGCARYVYNETLKLELALLESDPDRRYRWTKAINRIPAWKKEKTWLKECASQVLQQKLIDLSSSFEDLYSGKAKELKPRKKGINDSIRFPQHFEVDEANSRIKLPKLGWMPYRKSRNIEGEVKSITVKKDGDRWLVSILTGRDVEKPLPETTSAVGIDMGVEVFAYLSDGTPIPVPGKIQDTIAKMEKRIAVHQKQLKNKTKFSKNWKKLKKKIAKDHRKLALIRQDFHHKTSTTLSKNHAMIVVEDLNIKGLTKSAKGTKEKPGRNVKAKSQTNRSILRHGWGRFMTMLKYKTEARGGIYLEIHPAYTSRTCPECGHVDKANRPARSRFQCVHCGFSAHADHVGAINILRAGHARLACEVSGAVRPPATGTRRRNRGIRTSAQ